MPGRKRPGEPWIGRCGNGAPVRLRVERHCGYKHLKFVKSIEAVASFEGIGQGTGGINSDWGFHWYAGA